MRHLVFGPVLFTWVLAAGFSAGWAHGPAASRHAPAHIVPIASTARPQPPLATIKPKIFIEHGRRRVDSYYWLRERDHPEVVAYLEAENAYADACLAPLKPLIDEICAELTSRARATDFNPPFLDNGYYYQRRFTEGSEYQVIVRHKGSLDASPEVVLDIPALAAKHAQFHLGRWVVSPDNALVAYAVDFTGDGAHQIFVKNLATGKVIDDGVKDVNANFVFAADSRTLFYTVGNQVWRHSIGRRASSDALVHEERDDTFEVSLSLSKSRKVILLVIENRRTSEVRYLAADKPSGRFKVIERRRHGVHYSVDHVGDRFFIRTNLAAPDFRVVTAPQRAPRAANWTQLIPHTPGRLISHFEVFDRLIAIDEEHDAVKSLRLFRLPDMAEIPAPRAAALGVTAAGGLAGVVNRDPASTVLRFRTTGPLEPERIYDFDVATGEVTLRKQHPAAEWFKADLYEMKRLFATAPDGERIPVTLIYRKDLRRAGGNPILIEGYGAYCLSQQPVFPGTWFSLIDRGFAYAIAHVRGGCDMGRRWYDEGRILKKFNTFTDFIAVTEALITHGYADPRNVFAYGASAGGLLMGAIANLRPELYAGIVAEVPFVDVITTMSDPTVPLTTWSTRNGAIRRSRRSTSTWPPIRPTTT
jgi:oligopeptidase B